jgi:hypothetical protein
VRSYRQQPQQLSGEAASAARQRRGAAAAAPGHFVKSSAPRAADANMSAPHKKRLVHIFENSSKGHLEHEDGTYDGDVNERADGTRLAHGSGTRTFSDGSVFVGTFRDGVPVHGDMTYGTDGSKFMGAVNERFELHCDGVTTGHGKAIFTEDDGTAVFEGMPIIGGMGPPSTHSYGATLLKRVQVEYRLGVQVARVGRPVGCWVAAGKVIAPPKVWFETGNDDQVTLLSQLRGNGRGDSCY